MMPAQATTDLPNDLVIRALHKDDFDLGYVQLLSQLTTVGDISHQMYLDRFQFMEKHAATYHPVVIHNTAQNKIVGSATLLIEHKFIHECGLVGHIEDVVVDKDQRGLKLGMHMVTALIKVAKQKACYKLILNCSVENAKFYEKCGFVNKGVECAIYF